MKDYWFRMTLSGIGMVRGAACLYPVLRDWHKTARQNQDEAWAEMDRITDRAIARELRMLDYDGKLDDGVVRLAREAAHRNGGPPSFQTVEQARAWCRKIQ